MTTSSTQGMVENTGWATGFGEDWSPAARGRALCIIAILANTPPESWASKEKLHAQLAEFRTKPALGESP